MGKFFLITMVLALTDIFGSGETHLYESEIFLKVTDFRVPEKNISAQVVKQAGKRKLQKICVENGSDSYEIDPSEYDLLTRPLIKELMIKGSAKNTDLLFLSLNFLGNDIPVNGIRGKECQVTFVLNQEGLLYQVIYVQAEKRMLMAFKAAGEEHYVSKFSEMRIKKSEGTENGDIPL